MQLDRRTFLRGSATAGLLVPVGGLVACGPKDGAAASLSRSKDRPVLTHGVAAGDPRRDGALIWARSDRPARMVVETSATEDFSSAKKVVGPMLQPNSDGTGRVRLTGLEPGQTVHYRVRLEAEGLAGEPVSGVFRTAPAAPSNIRLVWSGDVAGQGWGIDESRGGMKGFAAMADRNPDIFVHSGDTIYADGPLEETVALPDGGTWRNSMSKAKSAVAQSLDEFRGNFAYNLTDANYRRFNASTAQIVQWDDHETVNNWYPGETLSGKDAAKYQVKDVNTLAARAFQAFHEWQPMAPTEAVDGRIFRKISYGPLLDIFVLDMRTYKDANGRDDQPVGHIFGQRQTDWLIKELTSSTATWKLVANDLPLGIVVPDGDTDQEALAQGDPGAPKGRETELARILSGIKDVPNVVWLTADVHYTAANHYDPARASFTDFRPFWEFVSGPLHAGAFPAGKLDKTFGVDQVFVHAPTDKNVSPATPDFQHFGEVAIDGGSRELTVNLCDITGATLHTQRLTPA